MARPHSFSPQVNSHSDSLKTDQTISLGSNYFHPWQPLESGSRGSNVRPAGLERAARFSIPRSATEVVPPSPLRLIADYGPQSSRRWQHAQSEERLVVPPSPRETRRKIRKKMRQILSRARKIGRHCCDPVSWSVSPNARPSCLVKVLADMFAITRSIDRKVDVQSPDKPEARICF